MEASQLGTPSVLTRGTSGSPNALHDLVSFGTTTSSCHAGEPTGALL